MLTSILTLLAVAGGACVAQADRPLRGYADDMGFVFGSVIHGVEWARDQEYREVLAREFNSGQAIVFMKVMEKTEGDFNWKPLDRQIAYANEHGLRLMGHALIYRRDTLPGWAAKLKSPQRMDEVMRDFIQAIVKRGGDTFFAWVVVNEPLTARNKPWEIAFGREGYISRAFHYTREVSPDSLLVLNETFGREGVDLEKARRFFSLVGNLKAQGVPVDAVGIQLHLEAHRLRPEWLSEFKQFLSMAEDAGVLVFVTEMDVYQGGEGRTGHPDQVAVFQQVVDTCLGATHCRGIYTWGVSDRYTWLRRRKRNPYVDAAPLLFDDAYVKKPAYFAIVESLRRARHAGLRKVSPW